MLRTIKRLFSIVVLLIGIGLFFTSLPHLIRTGRKSCPLRYDVGQTVDVAYDPEQPQRSLLEGRFDHDTMLKLLTGAALIVFAVFRIRSGKRRHRVF
jgi:hypothetical protein